MPMSQSPGALHECDAARWQQCNRLTHRVVGGEPRVRQRGYVSGVGGRVEADTRPRTRAQVLGHATVVIGHTGESACRTSHVAASPACRAQSVGRLRVQDHGVADLDVGDAGADRVHPARVLVSQGVGQPRAHCLGPLPGPIAWAHCPSVMCRSVRHTPAPPIRTMTSSGPDSTGSGTSSTVGCLW